MHKLTIRCSSLGRLMTEPKSKSEVLSVGAKTYIRDIAKAAIFGVEPEISSKAMEKGILCEEDSIRLYNSVFFKNYKKNTDRRTANGLTGEPDIVIPGVIGVDIKTSWSLDTFPLWAIDCKNDLYEWQMRGYMKLFETPHWQVAYCLVDTPEDLIGYESQDSHIVSGFPEQHRVTVVSFDRDLEKEALIDAKIKAAGDYYLQLIEEFDKSHA